MGEGEGGGGEQDRCKGGRESAPPTKYAPDSTRKQSEQILSTWVWFFQMWVWPVNDPWISAPGIAMVGSQHWLACENYVLLFFYCRP